MTDIVHEPPSLQSSRPSVNSTLAPGIVTSPPPGKINKTEKQPIDEKQPSSSGNDAPVTNGMDDHPKALEAGVAGIESSDVIIVTWDGPDDVLNPKNWSKKKKWAATAVVSSYTFISPIASSMVSPAAAKLGSEFHITNSVILSMTVSIFILAYSFGPLFLGPLSEIFGRVRVLQIANLFFMVFNIACGFSQNTGQLLAFRLLSGLGGSAPLAIGGGVLGDCWSAEQRGQAVAIYSLAPVLGPCLGPVAGAWIAEKTTWRWVFWSTSILCGFIQILGFIYLRETFAPILLEQKAKQVRRDMGLSPDDHHRVRTEYESPDRHWQQIFGRALVRPFLMFYRESIIQLLGIYAAFIYGLIYLILVTIPDIFQSVYHQRVGIAGLHYLALGIGLTGTSQINARMMDIIYRHLKGKNGGKGKPEYRLPSMMVGVFILPFGLLLFGWAAQERVFWIVADLGIVLIGAGMILVFHSLQSYVIDTFTLHAASALAAVSCLRSLAGFGFPLFAPAMYQALGYGKGDTILAVLGIVLGWPAPFLFWRFGERIRQRSSYVQ